MVCEIGGAALGFSGIDLERKNPSACLMISFAVARPWCDPGGPPQWFLLQPEAFIHQALQARAVDEIVGEFFIGKHAECGPAGIRGHLRRLFHG